MSHPAAFAPPAYSSAVDGSHSPQSFMIHREPVTHSYPLGFDEDKAWATLHVVSKALSADSLPHLLEGEPITGSVDLDLAKEKAIKSITISVTGELVTNMDIRYTFAKDEKVLWEAKKDAANSLIAENPLSHADHSKLQGTFHFPFSLQLPETVELPLHGGTVKSYRLPCSFSIRHTFVTVYYSIVATIHHSFLLPEPFGTMAAYTAKTKPGSPSPARALAYSEGSPLPGPSADPDGWHTLPPSKVLGTVNRKSVDVTYTLSLAKPVSYTKGTVIPLHLSIESTDEKALTTTSNPNAPNVALLRTIALGYGFGGAPVEHPDKTRLANEHHMTQVPKVRSVDEVQSATWWADPGAKPSAGKRELQGELHLDRQLYSTGHISLFDLFYNVALFPPHPLSGFKPKAKDVLQTVPVEICVMFPDGPSPVAYSVPKPGETIRLAEDTIVEGTEISPYMRGVRLNFFASNRDSLD